MIDRRRLLLTAAAGAGMAAAGPAFARSEADDRLDGMLNRWFDEDVDSSPETATNLGLDRGARAHLSSKLSDAASRPGWPTAPPPTPASRPSPTSTRPA